MSLKFRQIRLLVSMATDRVIMEKRCCHFFSAVLDRIHFIRAGNDNIHESWMGLNFSQIRLLVSMATDRVIMEKTVLPLFLGYFLSDQFHTCR